VNPTKDHSTAAEAHVGVRTAAAVPHAIFSVLKLPFAIAADVGTGVVTVASAAGTGIASAARFHKDPVADTDMYETNGKAWCE